METMQNTFTQVHEIAQAMSGWMDKVDQHLEYVCSDQKEEADLAVGYAIFGLKTEIMRELDQEVTMLETRLEAEMNEACQATATLLQEIKYLVVAVRKRKKKYGGL